MTVENERLKAARVWLAEHGYDAMLACADGQNSFLESNAVYVFTNIRSIGRSAVIIEKNGPSTLIVEPAYDGDRVRAIAAVDRVIATDTFPQTLSDALGAVSNPNHSPMLFWPACRKPQPSMALRPNWRASAHKKS
jgi:hypothetical protein